mmetsp:Transcript_53089/g.153115  ORF Transcript_53089/g.153115 Transcript_53089/m.153115 type:complete len:215 (-) Transcript_53089:169-813(-)
MRIAEASLGPSCSPTTLPSLFQMAVRPWWWSAGAGSSAAPLAFSRRGCPGRRRRRAGRRRGGAGRWPPTNPAWLDGRRLGQTRAKVRPSLLARRSTAPGRRQHHLLAAWANSTPCRRRAKTSPASHRRPSLIPTCAWPRQRPQSPQRWRRKAWRRGAVHGTRRPPPSASAARAATRRTRSTAAHGRGRCLAPPSQSAASLPALGSSSPLAGSRW